MIRHATPVDIPRILEMAERFINNSAYSNVLTFRVEALERLADVVVGQLGAVLIATVPAGGSVAMFVVVALEDPLTGDRYAEEVAWWVEPEHRGGLIGPRLLAAAETWARENKCPVLRMRAPVGSDVGAFYLRRGYTEVETIYVKVL